MEKGVTHYDGWWQRILSINWEGFGYPKGLAIFVCLDEIVDWTIGLALSDEIIKFSTNF